ncbi:hypothetical protein O6H91_04G075600 [Diphasiastrum complanatum]|nr:hypothetical protein O6H91_04G075600 [Diphasiastrum complanatum]
MGNVFALRLASLSTRCSPCQNRSTSTSTSSIINSTQAPLSTQEIASSSSSSSSAALNLLSSFSPPSSAYVHLPFCRRRCFYCDFPVVAVGERSEASKPYYDSTMLNYVDLVCREISATARGSPGGPLNTIFFGGGTPSLLPPYLLHRILDCLQSNFGLSSQMEISIEMDPGTFNGASLSELIDYGVNRVSVGVQSFNEKLLKACGRAHSLKDVYDAIEIIHSSSLDHWSLDLIASLPFLTPDLWMHSLTEAVEASPTHISVYDLQIEEGTKFGKWYASGQHPLPCEDDSAEFYRTASRKLREGGYDHYEVSNYAKTGYQCKHNLVYWRNLPYYAFGLGSTSYVERRRFSRPRKMKAYAAFVDDFEKAEGKVDFPEDSIEERILDTIMLSLRLAQGLNLREFAQLYGRSVTVAFCRGLQQFVESGHVKLLDIDGKDVGNHECHERHGIQWDVVERREETIYMRSFQTDPEAISCKPLRTKIASDWQALFGQDLPSFLKPDTVFVRLSDPEGFLLSNEIISSLFSAMSIVK